MINYVDMTDEEYEALDEELTRTVPRLGPNGSGWLSQRDMRVLGLAATTINYLLAKAMADHKSPARLIDELVDKEIAAAG
ncbi:MAG: hypothetical protein FWG35_01120 [Spirochaetaceae bacterium]|nr:hypothetical protein [Spirochaetaceae bacterium]